MIKQIIKEQMKYYNYSSSDLAIKTDLTKQTISKLLQNKQKMSFKISEKLGKVFDFPGDLLIKYSIKSNNLNQILKDNDMQDIANILVKQEEFQLFSNESLLEIVSNMLKSNTVKDRKKDLEKFVIGFRKYKDKPNAYLWISLLENEYGAQKSKGLFKKSNGKTVIKGVLDILINDKDFKDKEVKLKSFLDKYGIILINAPFLKDSTINGVTYKRNTQRFIFMSDKNKREYAYIFSLMHELEHLYGKKEEKDIDEKVANNIQKYFKKYSKNHKDLQLAFQTYKINDSTDAKWNKLHKNTTKKINFGSISTLLNKYL